MEGMDLCESSELEQFKKDYDCRWRCVLEKSCFILYIILSKKSTKLGIDGNESISAFRWNAVPYFRLLATNRLFLPDI